MKSLLPILAAFLLSACTGASLRGTGDMGIVIERASGSVAVVDSSTKSILGRIEGLGDLSHASAVYSRDGRYAYVFGRDGGLKAKILFVLADLRERQKSYDDATDRWIAYETFAKQATQTKTYPATAADRKKRVAEWKQLLEQYGAVKKRIEQRLKEADDKAKKSAQ